MNDKTVNAITKIIVRLCNAADYTIPPEDYLRAVIRKRFPEATEEMIRAGWRRAAVRFEARAKTHEAEAERLKREQNRDHEFLFELQEVSLETGITLGPDTRIGEFLDQAARAGNERARRLLAALRGGAAA